MKNILTNNDPWPIEWQHKIRSEFRKNVKTFLREPTIQRTMHPSGACKKYWDFIQHRYDLTRAATDSNVGKPITRSLYGDMSLVSMQCVMYRMLMEEHEMVDFDSIVELGGGYGNNARFQRRLKFNGPIRILDLPVMIEIQKYFIKENNLSNIACLKYNESTAVPETDNALFFATFSLNEIPIEDRIHLSRSIDQFKYIFIAYKPNSFNMDNVQYFQSFTETLNSIGFNIIEVPHPLSGSKTRFVLGKRK